MNKLRGTLLMIVLVFINISIGLFIIATQDKQEIGQIRVVRAEYGGNCQKSANVVESVSNYCNNKQSCIFKIQSKDPAPGCPKDFTIKWTCSRNRLVYPVFYINLEGESLGKEVKIECPNSANIE